MTMVISKNWKQVLKEEFENPYLQDLKQFILKEKERGMTIYPPMEDVFRAFSYTPYEQVKVVIIGQDPYHGPKQAHGLCFSVQKGIPIPPSLRNIYKELHSDMNLPIADHGCLSQWAAQGVLLLNSTLTVNEGSPKSHVGQGWERFTDAVVKKLVERKDPLVFILWGNSAHKKGEMIENSFSNHIVLKSAHPSPLSARRFFGCRHFSKTNEILTNWKKESIDWRIT